MTAFPLAIEDLELQFFDNIAALNNNLAPPNSKNSFEIQNQEYNRKNSANQNSQETPLPLAPLTLTPSLSESVRVQHIEIEKTKELNEKNVKIIRGQMRQEEITSLKVSIQYDEKLLKNRRTRLKELSKK